MFSVVPYLQVVIGAGNPPEVRIFQIGGIFYGNLWWILCWHTNWRWIVCCNVSEASQKLLTCEVFQVFLQSSWSIPLVLVNLGDNIPWRMVGLRPTKTDHGFLRQDYKYVHEARALLLRLREVRSLGFLIICYEGIEVFLQESAVRIVVDSEDDWTIRTLFWRLGTIKIAILETIWMAWPKCVWMFASLHLSGSAHENKITPQIHASRKTHHFNVNIIAPPAASSCVVYQKAHHPLVPVPRWRMPWVLPWKHEIPRNCARRCVVVLWCHWVVGWLWCMWCPTSSDELHDTMPEKYLCGRSTQDLRPSTSRKWL